MHLMYYKVGSKRVYSLKKERANGDVTVSAHPGSDPRVSIPSLCRAVHAFAARALPSHSAVLTRRQVLQAKDRVQEAVQSAPHAAERGCALRSLRAATRQRDNRELWRDHVSRQRPVSPSRVWNASAEQQQWTPIG